MQDSPGQDAAPNRLISETSPYLLQHAHNPVDWYPWGPEAFAAARARSVPIFLSIGYSTCYWCHVMERESFESPAIAAIMNERFVCIKVDREQRPDVDDLYMAATQAYTGSGGWPMSVFLEPETLRPFWCGTYFPTEPRHGIPSFPQVLEGMSRAWNEQRGQVLAQSEQLAEVVRQYVAEVAEPAHVGASQIEVAVSTLLAQLDRTHGGFGGAPKFPQPAYLDFLLSVRASLDDDARTAVDHALRLTLDRMAIGGIRDHVGGGFHRYAVDAIWLVPHFEKMLYDNAQLASVYARAAEVFEDAEYRRVVRDILDYVRREMMLDAERAPNGAVHAGFASAQDAEVNHREGQNYLWTIEQVQAALGGEDGTWAAHVYGLDLGTNFRDPHHPDDAASNVLRLADRPEALATAEGVSAEDSLARLQRVNRKLLEARIRREQPMRDDKALASWNGLMITAFARASSLFDDRELYDVAERAARFVLEHMTDDEDRLFRVWRQGKSSTPAFLEDYAAIITALLALHRAAPGFTADAAFAREAAAHFARLAEAEFGDGEGVYHDTRAEQNDLFVRARSTYDGAVPSGASTMLHALIDLAEATNDPADIRRAARALRAMSGAIARGPVPAINATRALHRAITHSQWPETLLALIPEPAAAPAPPPNANFTPVEVFASTDRVRVAPDEPGEIHLSLRIAEGYHIVAADPGPAGSELVPLRVGLVAGTGVSVYADYPEGEPFGEGGELRVHFREIALRIAIERNAEPPARPILGLTFQACTDTECLLPQTVELDVAIDLDG